LQAAPAKGDARPQIIALLEHADAPFLPRLRAELASAGFGIVVVTPPSWPPNRHDIERLARQQGAIAGLSLVDAGAAVEIWVVDRVTSKTVFRDVIWGSEDDRRSGDLIAIRVVETLRATLMEVEQPRSSPGEVAPPPEITVLLERAPSRFAVSLGGGGGYSKGGIGATGHIGLALSWAPHPRYRLGIGGFMTPGRVKVGGPEGQASIGLFLVGPSLAVYLNHPTAPVRLSVGAGGWLSVMTMSGEAVSPYVNTSDRIVSFVPHLDLGVRISLTKRVGLGAGISGGASLPGAEVQFAGRAVANWGRPFALGILTLESYLD
jgi:hypothetical protein